MSSYQSSQAEKMYGLFAKIREMRAQYKVDPKAKIKIAFKWSDEETAKLIASQFPYLRDMCGVECLMFVFNDKDKPQMEVIS